MSGCRLRALAFPEEPHLTFNKEWRKAMARRVVIDTDECTGCETCVELCPEVFAFNEDQEKAEVIMPEGGPEDCIEDAIESCPVECISWEE
jgi:ferredoxin